VVRSAGDRRVLPAVRGRSVAMSRHRRRSLLFGAVALGLVALTVFMGGSHHAPPEPTMRQVVELRRSIAAGQRIAAADLSTVEVPAIWADPHQLSDPSAAIGRPVAVAVPAGSPLMDAELAPDAAASATREVTLRLDDAAGLPLDPPDGMAADLYLVEAGRPPRVSLVLRGAFVVSSSRSDGVTRATLRVEPQEVAALIEAEGRGSLRLVGRSGR
jgi:Flp pilus assembly protein CpaB